MKRIISTLLIVGTICLPFTNNLDMSASSSDVYPNQLQEEIVGKTISETFPDNALRNKIAYKLSKSINDPLDNDDIIKFTNLNLHFENIYDITGLEVFKNLENLNLDRNKVESLVPLLHKLIIELEGQPFFGQFL